MIHRIRPSNRTAAACAALAAAACLAGTPGAVRAEAEGVGRTECDAREPDVDPSADPEAYQARDERNQRCSLQRMIDEYTNPANGVTFWVDETPRLYLDNVLEQLFEPTRPRATLMQWIPGGRTTDPYRTPERWSGERHSAARGRVTEVSFILEDGAKTRGYLFTPLATDPEERLPGIVITTGSIQGYQEMYFWAAEALAEAGYMVLTYDVQGQGRGETLPHHPDGSIACDAAGCTGVPFQQGYNFEQGTRDALDFFTSTALEPYAERVPAADPDHPNAAGTDRYNPLHALLDRTRIGLAGHSAGAGAVSRVGQERGCGNAAWLATGRACVSAIVGWDSAGSQSRKTVNGNPAVAADGYYALANPITAPVLSLTAEYFFNPGSRSSDPEPESGLGTVNQASCDGSDPASCHPSVCFCRPDPDDPSASICDRGDEDGDGACDSGVYCNADDCRGVDAMRVAQRSSTHLEYSYVPYILPASRYGERVASYYTLAWFDRYLRGGSAADLEDAFARLTAAEFDDSADRSSIGQGTWNADANENVPYEIAGDCTADRMSIYFTSRAVVSDPVTAQPRTIADMRRELRDLCAPPEER